MMKIAFVGGGTLGPVTPLLAVYRAMKKLSPQMKGVWIGTPMGPERSLVEIEKIPFFSLPVVKLPRYFSPSWITFPFRWISVKSQAAKLLDQIKPDAIVTAGGFTAVPVVYVASQRGIPCFTHQLDLIPGLANKKIAPLCRLVTTSFEYEKAPFGSRVTDEWMPTPVWIDTSSIPSKESALRHFGLQSKQPIVLIFGGGTGAQALNEMVERTLSSWLSFSQVIHVTGQSKGKKPSKMIKGYVQKDFLGEEMIQAYAAADVVICRAGMGSLSEVTALQKPTIVVPIPSSQQEANAQAFEEQGAVLVVRQGSSFDDELLKTVQMLLKDRSVQTVLLDQAKKFFPTDDGTALAKRILQEL